MNNKKTDYSIVNQQQPRPVQAKKKPPFIRILRALIQLVSFIILPGLFISIFSSIGAIYSAIITGSFTWTEYAGRIVLVAAAFIITAGTVLLWIYLFLWRYAGFSMAGRQAYAQENQSA